MEIKAQAIRLQYTEDGKIEIILTTDHRRAAIQQDTAQLREVIKKGKELAVEIKAYRQRRSLDANAYFWLLLSKLADALNTSKDELYLYMLERYGVFTHIVVKPHLVDRVKQEWKAVRELGPVKINGKEGFQLQCFFGSSTYTTEEMARLINGIVSECRDLGIETLPPEELQRMKSEWDK